MFFIRCNRNVHALYEKVLHCKGSSSNFIKNILKTDAGSQKDPYITEV
jgi:hypothetical protein